MARWKQQYFVVTDGFSYEVMSEREIEATGRVWLASGGCDTRAEAERIFEKGLADGTYENTDPPGVRSTTPPRKTPAPKPRSGREKK